MLDFKEPTWAHAELFGHSSYFGRVREVTFCGSPGLAIEPATVDGMLPAFFAAGSAIFRLTPMSEEDVRHAALPRAFRACEVFQPAPIFPASCRTCGRNEQEHEEERQRKALPAATIPDASFEEEGDGQKDDIPFEPRAAANCDHGLIFDEERARGMTSSEVREQFPRLFGSCPKGCGFSGIAYVSGAHFVYGDW